MIKFYRRLRQKLLAEGKFRKYLIYAIGEIVLVVIGILIALSINNWNEGQKKQRIEEIILSDINRDLIQTKEDLIRNLSIHDEQINVYNQLIHNVEIEKVYHDSLAAIFGSIIFWESPYLTLATYENLKVDKGIDIISNDSLKKKIIDLHERDYKTLIGDVEREEWINTETLTRPILLKHFNYIERGNVVPKDYDGLINDADYLNALKFTIDLRKRTKSDTEYNIMKTQEVIDAITTELNQ